MKQIYILLIAIFPACQDNTPEENTLIKPYEQYDQIIQQDLSNKQKELDILRELRTAQQNNDAEARDFFMQEYMKVPRLSLTPEQQMHPDFRPWLNDSVIKSDELMLEKYNYIKK